MSAAWVSEECSTAHELAAGHLVLRVGARLAVGVGNVLEIAGWSWNIRAREVDAPEWQAWAIVASSGEDHAPQMEMAQAAAIDAARGLLTGALAALPPTPPPRGEE